MDAHFYETIVRRRNGFQTPDVKPPNGLGTDLDLANGSGVMGAGQSPADDSRSDELDLDTAIARMQAATAEFINGKPGSWKARCSHLPTATLFGGWGGHERGWQQLDPRYDWAAARFAGGEVTFEELARHVSSDLACTIQIERMRARLAGMEQPATITLRVTQIYGREATGWKLVHRHADHLTAIQPAESVAEQ
jgi:hypothetical protein